MNRASLGGHRGQHPLFLIGRVGGHNYSEVLRRRTRNREGRGRALHAKHFAYDRVNAPQTPPPTAHRHPLLPHACPSYNDLRWSRRSDA